MTGSEVYHLVFTRAMMEAPILHNLGKRFRVTVVLRRALLSEEGGTAEVILIGAAEEIGRAVADLNTTGVSVSGPLESLVGADTSPVILSVGRGT
jgi:hypothetical protein